MESNRYSFTPSSVYSSTRPSSLDTTRSSLHQRVPTQTPSYMNAAVPVQTNHTPTNSIPRVPVPSTPTHSAAKGLLLLAIAASPPKELKTYVETLLSRSPAAEVAILGLTVYEPALKQLKMDMYGLAGKLSLELGVQLLLREEWATGALDNAIHEALGRKSVVSESPNGRSDKLNGSTKEIKGLICCPQGEHASDLLGINTLDLESSWHSSVGFLHAAAKGSIPWMVTRAQGVSVKSRIQGPFLFVTDCLMNPGNSLNSIHKPSMRALMDSLDRFYGPSGITFGYTEQELPYEPELEPHSLRTPPSTRGGKLSVNTQSPGGYYASQESAGDSPTKLWACTTDDRIACQNAGRGALFVMTLPELYHLVDRLLSDDTQPFVIDRNKRLAYLAP